MAITRETLRLLAGMRISLGTDVDEVTAQTARAWASAWNEIRADIDNTIRDILTATDSGQRPSRALIDKVLRERDTLTIIRARLDRLAADSGIRVMQAIPTIVDRAAQFEAELIATQMPPGAGNTLAVTWNRVPADALTAIIKRHQQQITSLHRPLAPDATRAIRSELVRGIAAGTNPVQSAARIIARTETVFNGGLHRATVITRTEMLDAHRAAGHAQDDANRDVLAGWQWVAALDTRTCPACLAKHGSTHPVDETGPDDHQQGRCARVPLTKPWKELGFNLPEPRSLLPDAQQWFNNLPDGDKLTVMGPGRLAALNNGTLTWDGLATKRTTDGWRDSWIPTPITPHK